MINVLPNAIEKISIKVEKKLSASPFDLILAPKTILGVPNWLSGQSGHNKFWMHVGPINRFPLIYPIATLQIKENNQITGEIKYKALAKKTLVIWLATSIAIFVWLAGTFVYELIFDDGFIPYKSEGKTGQLHVFPWLLLFGLAHLSIFILFPAILINNSWKKTISFVNQAMQALEEYPISDE